jgi:hypothetical protein
VLGLAVGGLIRPGFERAGGVAPTVGWAVPPTLGFFALVLGALAWTTRRTLQEPHGRIDPHRAVNLLVLGKASALVGAFMAGAYAGFAVSFVRSWEVPSGRDRVVHSLVAALVAVVVMVGGLLLERACRIPDDGDEDGLPGRPDGTSGSDGSRTSARVARLPESPVQCDSSGGWGDRSGVPPRDRGR